MLFEACLRSKWGNPSQCRRQAAGTIEWEKVWSKGATVSKLERKSMMLVARGRYLPTDVSMKMSCLEYAISQSDSIT